MFVLGIHREETYRDLDLRVVNIVVRSKGIKKRQRHNSHLYDRHTERRLLGSTEVNQVDLIILEEPLFPLLLTEREQKELC